MASVEKEGSDDNADDLEGEGQRDASEHQVQGGAVSLKSGFESSDEFADYPGCFRKHHAVSENMTSILFQHLSFFTKCKPKVELRALVLFSSQISMCLHNRCNFCLQPHFY